MASNVVVIRGRPQLRGFLEAIEAEVERSQDNLDEVELTQNGSTSITLTCFDDGNPCCASQRAVLVDGTVSVYKEPEDPQ